MERVALLDDGVRPLDWVDPPVPAHTLVSECLWSPDAAPTANSLREAIAAGAASDASALDAYERVWFGTIVPRARVTPWSDDAAPLTPAWRPITGYDSPSIC
jgi:hypothetical protein